MRPILAVMSRLGHHMVAVVVIGVAIAALAGVFAFTRPSSHPYVLPSPPNDLPYTKVSYTVADARRAFAAKGIRLTARSSQPEVVTTIGNRGDILEVDVFADPEKVKSSGFHNYYTLADGRWVRAPRSCTTDASNAESWHGNVRVIVSCTRAGEAAGAWQGRVRLALRRLR